MMETLRRGLIAWNVAPLTIAGILVLMLWRLVDALISGACTMDPALYTVLAGVATGLGGLVYKVYNSLQRNKGASDETHS
jgi:uncharacterized membrane protein